MESLADIGQILFVLISFGSVLGGIVISGLPFEGGEVNDSKSGDLE